MNNVIYIDVLIAVNLFVNYFLLLATSHFTSKKVKKKRLILGAFVGSLFSILILFDYIGYIFVLAIKLILACFLVLITFGFGSKWIFIKNTLLFFGINFAFAGIMFALWLVVTPSGMVYNNGMVYFNISSLVLVVSTVIAYFIIKIVSFFMERRVKQHELYHLMIVCDGKQVLVSGFADTGNKLCDSISGLPIIICEFESVKDLIPTALHKLFLDENRMEIDKMSNHSWQKRIRIVPYHVVSDNGLMLCFLPDLIQVVDQKGKNLERKALIGVSNKALSSGEFNAIINTKILSDIV
ncbi:MAG: sigma-E processing peptidase SpoIIGA [Oscillospiraceae bacterium]|jgi:stage II sporulation protein GA (sporulation sigma-E factor processing peptidase)|nr:sigma-E processing peptidase SpoIIGA [Oscillospiraceae bacterium]